MANSSWFSTSNQYIKYRIEVTQNSQSVTNNKSNVTVKVWIYRTNTGYTTYGSGTCYCKINGTTYSASITSSQKITNSGIYLFSKTLDIGHNSDGSKSLTCSAWISHSQFSSSEQSASFGLTTIGRKSTISSITGGTIGGSMTVNINRASSSFTTTVWVQLGSSGWVQVATKSTATAITFTVPTSLANQLPNATSGNGQVIIRTYDANGNNLGDSSTGKQFLVPDYTPTIDSWNISEEGTGLGIYVQGKSKIKYSCSVSTSYGARIISYTWKFGSSTFSDASGTTGVWNSSGKVDYSLTVKDSRGKTATKSYSLTCIPYSKPVAKITSFYRCDASGNADANGDKVRVTITGTVASVSGKNTIKIVVQAQDKTTGTWGGTREYTSNQTNTVLTLNGYDTNKSYELKITVTDKWTTSTASVTIPTSYVILDLKAEGKGLAIGKVSEKDAFEVNMNEYLSGNIFFVGESERVIRHDNSDVYLYFHNSQGSYGNHEIGCYHKNNNSVWRYDSNAKQLLLKSGYGTISDKRLKYDYDEFENWDDFYSFYMSLRPMKFKYVNEMEDITYIGLLAQDVADSLVNNNLNNEKLALVRTSRNDDMDDGREYNLAYQELISLNIKMIQKHEKEIRELKDTIAQLKSIINKEDTEK